MLFYIFKIQKPVAPVFIVKNLDIAESLNTNINISGLSSNLVTCFCEVHEVLYISNKVDPDNYVIDKTLEAVDTIDDSIQALQALVD